MFVRCVYVRKKKPICQYKTSGGGNLVPEQTVGHLAYADDLVLFANNDVQFREKINILLSRLKYYGLAVNAKKPAICHIVFQDKRIAINNKSKSRCFVGKEEIRQMNILDSYR